MSHSLGGLVTQNAITISRSSAETHLQKIEASTIAVAFLGTPNHGSDLASWNMVALKILSAAKRPNTDIVAVLLPGSEMLALIQQGFGNILRIRAANNNEISVTCFYEELPLMMIGEVWVILYPGL